MSSFFQQNYYLADWWSLVQPMGDTGYEEGCMDGWEEGWDEGWEDEWGEGWELGWEEGWEVGKMGMDEWEGLWNLRFSRGGISGT